MGYLIGGCVNIVVILAAFVIFASLPGIFWGLMVALLAIVILGIRTGISNRQASTPTIPAVSTTDSLEDEIRHHEYKNSDPAQGIQHHDNPNV